MGYIEAPSRTFTASGAIGKHLRVALNGSGELALAGAQEDGVGVTEAAAFAQGEAVAVRLPSAEGTVEMTASAAVSRGDYVYGAAGGKVSSSPSGAFIGVALAAASGDGAVFEVMRLPAPAGGTVQFAELTFARADMTDNTDATGFVDFPTGAIPAGSQVLGWDATIATGFTGDTTAVMQVGVAGNLNQFSAITNGSCLAAGRIGSHAPGSSDNAHLAAAATPRVTITGGADFTSISAGAATVRVAFVKYAA